MGGVCHMQHNNRRNARRLGDVLEYTVQHHSELIDFSRMDSLPDTI